MDTVSQYQIVFSGQLRRGFDPERVRDALARQLQLSPDAAARLFDTDKRHLLGRAASQEEARRHLLRLARLGVIARIEAPAAEQPTAGETPAAGEATKAPTPQKTQTARHLPRFAPLPNNALFRAVLFACAGFEILAALLYALLLSGVMAGTFYYDIFTLWASNLVGHPLLALGLQLLCFPLGVLTLLLLAKPLLALRWLPHRGVRITPAEEPDLHAFVEDVCQRIGQSAPVEIRLNNDAAVNLYHHKGWIGFLRGRFVLCLGVPLVASLNSSQLAALIAQTILTFRGRHSPRASYLVMGANRWLQHAIHCDDAFDAGLRNWCDKGRLSPGMVRMLQRLIQWSRRMMKLRLMFSHLLERRLIHRLIAEADKRAYRLAGSEGFTQLLEQQRLLACATEEVNDALQQQWNTQGTLPDDMIEQLLVRARRYPAEIHNRLRHEQEQEKALTRDTIPGDAQRIKRLSRHHCVPAYACLSPANTLLRHFSKLVRTMSLRYYHNRLRIPVTPDRLRHQVISGSLEAQIDERLDHYFHGLVCPALPLGLARLMQEMGDPKVASGQWKQALRRSRDEFSRATLEYNSLLDAEEKLLQDAMHETLYRAELWRQLGDEKPRKEELESFYQQCRNSENAYEEALQKMAQFLEPYARRLAAALALLKARAKPGHGDKLSGEAQRLLEVFERIEAVLPQLRALKLHTHLLQTLLSYQGTHRQARLDDRIDEQAADIRQHLTSIRVALKDVANPYPAPRGGKMLMDYLLLESYTEATPAGDFDRGHDVVQRLGFLRRRLLARLVAIAGQVEPHSA